MHQKMEISFHASLVKIGRVPLEHLEGYLERLGKTTSTRVSRRPKAKTSTFVRPPTAVLCKTDLWTQCKSSTPQENRTKYTCLGTLLGSLSKVPPAPHLTDKYSQKYHKPVRDLVNSHSGQSYPKRTLCSNGSPYGRPLTRKTISEYSGRCAFLGDMEFAVQARAPQV